MAEKKKSKRGSLTQMTVEIPLLLAQRPHSKTELARHFDHKPHERTISRVIDELSVHLPITHEKRGREVYYLFMEGYEFKPPTLTAGELATLLLSQKAIGMAGGTTLGLPYAKYGESLLAKVRATLPTALREKLEALSNVYGTALIPAKDYSEFSESIDILASASAERRSLKIGYESLEGKKSERVVDVYAVYFDPDGGTLKVLGFDHKNHDLRTFSVDHVRKVERLDKYFVLPDGFSLKKHLDETCFNGIHGKPVTVRLRATGTTARIFSERTFHPSQRIVEADKSSTIIEMTVADGRGLERFVLGWLPEVEVLSPDHLREKIFSICSAYATAK